MAQYLGNLRPYHPTAFLSGIIATASSQLLNFFITTTCSPHLFHLRVHLIHARPDKSHGHNQHFWFYDSGTEDLCVILIYTVLALSIGHVLLLIIFYILARLQAFASRQPDSYLYKLLVSSDPSPLNSDQNTPNNIGTNGTSRSRSLSLWPYSAFQRLSHSMEDRVASQRISKLSNFLNACIFHLYTFWTVEGFLALIHFLHHLLSSSFNRFTIAREILIQFSISWVIFWSSEHWAYNSLVSDISSYEI